MSFDAIPNGKYGVVCADPPWTFSTRSHLGTAKSPQAHYDCMTIADISALPVSKICKPDAALFLWVTWPLLPQCLPVIAAWGFEYKGLAWEWIKFNAATGKYAFGTGYGTRKNLEPCLLATRGRPKRQSASVRDFIMSPRREHSRKPDEQYAMIEALFDGPYIELFARKPKRNWAAWGNELTT